MKSWLFLTSSIICEVVGTNFLRTSEGLTKLLPVMMIVIFYGLSFYTFSLSLGKIDLGFAYAIWAGCGTILVSISSYIFFKEQFTILKIMSILLIVTGVVGLHLSQSTQ